MNVRRLHSVLLRPHSRPSACFTRTKPRVVILQGCRNFATHRDPLPSSLLTSALDQKQRGSQRDESVGPFQLGVQPSLRHGEKVKKWSELSTGGKVTRAAARSTNLTVILLGAGFSAMLIYALTSELFSRNSPTVLYGNACDRIKASPRVATYLQGPLAFHNNPPSAVRPRHRNRHVSSQIFVDSTGREHMLLNFYVQGKPPGSVSQSDPSESYVDAIVHWTGTKASALSELSFDDAVDWTKDRASSAWERSKGVFRYLSGAPLPPMSLPDSPLVNVQEAKKAESSGWNFVGMFSGIRGTRTGSKDSNAKGTNGEMWTDGEVHADLVRNDEGYFVFRYLLIDIPSSKSRNPLRVFVERSNGVRENEPTIRWNS